MPNKHRSKTVKLRLGNGTVTKTHGKEHTPSAAQIAKDEAEAAAWAKRHKVKRCPQGTVDNAVSMYSLPTAKPGRGTAKGAAL